MGGRFILELKRGKEIGSRSLVQLETRQFDLHVSRHSETSHDVLYICP